MYDKVFTFFASQPSGGRESCFPIVYINDS